MGLRLCNIRKIYFCLLFLETIANLSQKPDDEKNLLKSLLSNYYSPSARPIKNHKESLEVKVQIALIDVIKLDEVSGCSTFKLWISMTWKDEFLAWNISLNNIKRINIPTRQPSIWLPDITIFNSLEIHPSDPPHPEAVCHHTGQVMWVRSIMVTLPNRYEFRSNSWISGLKLGSWTYNLNSIDLRPLSEKVKNKKASFIETKQFSGSDRWEITGTTSLRKVTLQECCDEPQVAIHATISLKKNTRIG